MSHPHKIILIFLVFAEVVLFGSYLSAQQISGFVFEQDKQGEKIPLPGVNVYWSGTTTGSFTDAGGRFKLNRNRKTDTQLVFSILGYRKDTVIVKEKNEILEHRMDPDKLQLSEVVITGKQDASYICKLKAQQTQVITTGELQRAACCNLAESFETNASIDVSYSDAVSGARQIQLLGLSGIYSQIMTENVPLIRGLATPFGLNYIPGTWMESIQVAKGTSSVFQGYESITGKINVEYKKPETAEKLYLNLYGNSNLRIEANGMGAIKINDKLSTSLLVHAADFRHKFDRNDDGFMDLPKLTTITAMNRWDYIIPNRWVSRFGIKYLYEDRNGGQIQFNKTDFTFDTTGITDGTKLYGIGITTNRFEAFWKNGIFMGSQGNMSLGLILSGINHQQDGFYGINKYHGYETNFNANLIFTAHFKEERHKISAGFSYWLDDFSESFIQTRLAYRYQYLPDTVTPTPADLFTLVGDSIVTYIMDRSEWAGGAFFEYTFDLKDHFSLIAGVRGDYNNRYGFIFTPRLHLRYTPLDGLSLRGSVGKGYRSPNLLAENNSVMISQRALYFVPDLDQETAWNYGINLTWDFNLFGRKAQLSADAYRTEFQKQIVADQDSLPVAMYFYNLDGASYANVVQAQFLFSPVNRLQIMAALRYNDVKITEGTTLNKKAMVNLYKGLLTLSYATKFDKWKFDVTGQLNGPARLPNTDKMPEFLRRPSSSPVWFNLLAQVTRKFKNFDVYLGGENLTNFRQTDPIVEYWKPYHTHFDASMVWGPVAGIIVYAGFRYTLK